MTAQLLDAESGERVSDSAETAVVIVVDRDELALTWSRYESGESGPGPHIHRQHADCFYVLHGELTFEAGPDLDAVRGGAGSFLLVPPGVVHTFRNEGPATARFLNMHAPNCGFAAHLRDESAWFDSEDPPADGGQPAAEVLVRGPEERLKCSHRDGIGSLAVREATEPTDADYAWALPGGRVLAMSLP